MLGASEPAAANLFVLNTSRIDDVPVPGQTDDPSSGALSEMVPTSQPRADDETDETGAIPLWLNTSTKHLAESLRLQHFLRMDPKSGLFSPTEVKFLRGYNAEITSKFKELNIPLTSLTLCPATGLLWSPALARLGVIRSSSNDPDIGDLLESYNPAQMLSPVQRSYIRHYNMRLIKKSKCGFSFAKTRNLHVSPTTGLVIFHEKGNDKSDPPTCDFWFDERDILNGFADQELAAQEIQGLDPRLTSSPYEIADRYMLCLDRARWGYGGFCGMWLSPKTGMLIPPDGQQENEPSLSLLEWPAVREWARFATQSIRGQIIY